MSPCTVFYLCINNAKYSFIIQYFILSDQNLVPCIISISSFIFIHLITGRQNMYSYRIAEVMSLISSSGFLMHRADVVHVYRSAHVTDHRTRHTKETSLGFYHVFRVLYIILSPT